MVKEATGKLNYKKTFILGFGFFAISLVWPLYNNYVPLFLKEFFPSQLVVNSIMTLDNILAIFLIPFISAVSDNTHTRFGRRKPFIMIGLPISALMFILLPMFSNDLLLFLIIITVLNFSMAIYRGPTVALMPDMIPSHQRSEANAVINFMGGLAAVFVLYGGSRLYKINNNLPFLATGIVMLISLLVIIFFIKEPSTYSKSESDEKVKIISTLKEIISSKDSKTLHLLFAILFWFIGYQGMEATFSNYIVHYIGLQKHESGIILSAFAAAFLIFAIPSGFIGKKLGKRKAILIGLTTDVFIFIIIGLMGPVGIIPFNKYTMIALLAVAGIFWSLVNINSYPYIVEGVDEAKVGTYTGFYYFSSSVAAITGPLIFGLFVDIIGFNVLFFLTAISFVAALLFMYTIVQTKKAE
ncbi:MFS transporter [Vallitalea maricola]|uniref:SLC45 family MFS transporter n=1 Tax=Vallitalea maricola TaxID=3074433 RepID=A0ACB5UMD4_9FIRM|nr:SLC45 family MFS transporter [Vallitalea sp. AN17-2]